ncbi:hypothetical protein PAJ34TS1_56420 [Paenibacillus azoreducens]|uniref:Uncharacterized protein n=1 Tax=Paenibacillus azoreducens TaxID=116718 RepID=A0A919YF07_9BACL|nr:hypothetical protein J34TS1_20070 [Paenibacillus azoreducens]
MGLYMGQRIIDGVYTYPFMLAKRLDLKVGIDSYLTEKDRTDLIATA